MQKFKSQNSKRKRSTKPARRRRMVTPGKLLAPSSINLVYSMMLQGESTLTSTSSGEIKSFIPFDPSSAGYSFNEWSTLSALYQEVKFVLMEIQLIPYQYAGPGSPLYVSYRFDTSTAPTSVSDVINSASLRLFNVTRDTTTLGMRVIARARGPLNWSPTSTVVTTPYAGCPGCFQLYGNTYDATTPLCLVRVRAVYAFRGRA
jgi:hypothetical protein